MERGHLRVYLGYGAGVGKTFAMLGEGHRRRERSTDVVIGFLETHGRKKTADQAEGLEVIPRKRIEYRGTVLEEMDVDAVLERRPRVALVDEIAHSNAPGSRNEKRWEDIEELRHAGIEVITTLNIQHLESLNDVVERITGVTQRETIPDEIVRGADQIELIDMSPWALRRRMSHGNIYPPEKIDVALSNYFREGNLTALRELALMWVADRVEESLQDYLDEHRIRESWETRERVLVGISGRKEAPHLIRRASRIAARRGAQLTAVHVMADEENPEQAKQLESHRRLVQSFGGSFHEVVGSDIAAALLDVARAENATQIVLGASTRSRWAELVRGSVINRVIRASGPIDVHVISSSEEEHLRLVAPRRPGLSRRRVIAGFVSSVVALPLLTAILLPLRDDMSLSTVLLLFLLVVVAISALGGWLPAILTAVAASLLGNFFFTPPYLTFTIAEAENAVGLVVFVGVAALVSWLVAAAARGRRDAERGRSEAQALARLAGSLLRSDDPLPSLLQELLVTFGLKSAAIMHQTDGRWLVDIGAGESLPGSPEDGSSTVSLGDDGTLVLVGPGLAADDRRVLTAFAAQLAVAVRSRRLGHEVTRASEIARVSDLRASLLAAVSHDLRTPLASIKASVTSLRQGDVAWAKDETDEFLTTINEETDRLTTLIGNLLDMSRLQAGAVQMTMRSIGLEEIVWRALATLHGQAKSVDVDVPESLPGVRADGGLLERAVANLVANAVTHSPASKRVRVDAAQHSGWVMLRVVDQGPGIAEEDRSRVFQPFQRLGNGARSGGVGLGLAVARGFVEAMGGRLVLADTPGGGLTVIVSLEIGA